MTNVPEVATSSTMLYNRYIQFEVDRIYQISFEYEYLRRRSND